MKRYAVTFHEVNRHSGINGVDHVKVYRWRWRAALAANLWFYMGTAVYLYATVTPVWED